MKFGSYRKVHAGDADQLCSDADEVWGDLYEVWLIGINFGVGWSNLLVERFGGTWRWIFLVANFGGKVWWQILV